FCVGPTTREIDSLVVHTESTIRGAEVSRVAFSDRLSYLAAGPGAMRSILAGAFVFQALTTLTDDGVGGQTTVTYTWSFVRTFADLVGNGCPVLETLELSVYVDGGPIDQGTNFVLAPLGACTRVQVCRLLLLIKWPITRVPQGFNPTDLDWSRLISKWQDLRLMQYCLSRNPREDGYDKPLDVKPPATINTLTAFSRSCRQLARFIVPLTVSTGDLKAALQGDILSFSSSIKFINFLGGPIEDDVVEALATLLLRLTRDDVDFHPGGHGGLDYLEEEEEGEEEEEEEYGFDTSTTSRRSNENWRAAKKLIDSAGKQDP
ncbi:hypothetical protein FS837_002442, partial [Tulasnella sp. UAMH 9824]